jgi:tetratricopeptide (TPR) repeat protein
MKRHVFAMFLVLLSWHLYAPPNCEIYKSDKACYQSCHEAWKAIRYHQGSYTSQEHFNKSIALCSTFPYSYMEKAVPYLKRGLFIEWKKLIDRAVELDPEQYLGYRGWCRLQFLRDYEGAINDIETLKSITDYDIGYCQTGDYHLNIALAYCYKEIGAYGKAKALYDAEQRVPNYSPGLFDYYHYGVLEFELGNYNKALAYFDQQIVFNDDLAECYFFKALSHKGLNQIDDYSANLEKAKNYYQRGKILTDTYTEPLNKIYLKDILDEMKNLDPNH